MVGFCCRPRFASAASMTVHILIKGKVQGVYFRASCKDMADQLDIRGWVRNTVEGHVEVMACGEATKINRLLAWCRQGPPGARVEEALMEEITELVFEKFSIERR